MNPSQQIVADAEREAAGFAAADKSGMPHYTIGVLAAWLLIARTENAELRRRIKADAEFSQELSGAR